MEEILLRFSEIDKCKVFARVQRGKKKKERKKGAKDM